jgi:hypothetical protein
LFRIKKALDVNDLKFVQACGKQNLGKGEVLLTLYLQLWKEKLKESIILKL